MWKYLSSKENVKKNCRIILLTICRFYRIKVLTLFILNIALALNLSMKATLSFLYLYLKQEFRDLQVFYLFLPIFITKVKNELRPAGVPISRQIQLKKKSLSTQQVFILGLKVGPYFPIDMTQERLIRFKINSLSKKRPKKRFSETQQEGNPICK